MLAFFGQVQQLHLLLPLLRERQVVPVLCIVFQQREIWGRLGASGATFFSETFSVVWLYRALLLGTAEERQARCSVNRPNAVQMKRRGRFTQPG